MDAKEDVYIIEVNPRSSRTVPFLSKATGYSLADIATLVGLGVSLKDQGLTEVPKDPCLQAAEKNEACVCPERGDGYQKAESDQVPDPAAHAIDVVYPKEKERFYVKAPAFSFSKLGGMDAYLSGMTLRSYGTVVVSVADEDKLETIPLIRRFYDMGFNIEATSLTGEYLKAAGIRTRIRHKPSEGSEEILESIRAGYVSYVINTRAILSGIHYGDGVLIRACAAQHNVAMLTSLDTVRMLLDVLEELTVGISTIDGA